MNRHSRIHLLPFERRAETHMESNDKFTDHAQLPQTAHDTPWQAWVNVLVPPT